MRQRVALVLLSSIVAIGVVAPSAGAARPSDGMALTFATVSGAHGSGGSAHRPGFLAIHPQAYAHAKAVAERRANDRSPVSSPETGTTDPAAGPSWQGQFETDLTPPDPTGAIGPNSYIELTNLRFGIYGRDGSLVSQGTMQDLSNLPQTDLSDPQIAWDPYTGLFYYVILDFNTNQFGIGFSRTSNPQSAADFCKYVASFGYGSLILPDYPKLGFSKDFLLIGANEFLLQSLYNGSDVDWMSKPAAGPLSTCPDPSTFKLGSFKSLTNADGSSATTPVPAVQTDPNGTGWVTATPDASVSTGHFISLFPITKSGTGTALLGSPKTLTVNAFDVPAQAPQPGGPPIDTLDGRLEHTVSGVDPNHGSVNAIWTAHAVFGGAGSEERWYEIDPTGPSLLQQGKATSTTLDVWNGAVAPDRAVNGASTAFGADMVMGFNTSSSTQDTAIQMISKVGSNPQSGFVMVQQSPGIEDDYSCYSPYGPPCRWGDYSGASADPAASPSGSTGNVWLSGEWNVASTDSSGVDWRTWNWKATPGTSTATLPSAPQNLTATPGNGTVDLAWNPPLSDGGASITYSVYRGTSSSGELPLQTGVAGTSFHDSGLTNGQQYFYEVTAVNSAGEGPVSNEASATPTAPTETVPGAPTNVKAAAGKGKITVSWAAPSSNGGSPLTKYRVYRVSFGLLAEVEPTILSFADSTVSRRVQYCYYVTAVNAVGEGPASATVCATSR
jgi:Fibronectin type III domain